VSRYLRKGGFYRRRLEALSESNKNLIKKGKTGKQGSSGIKGRDSQKDLKIRTPTTED